MRLALLLFAIAVASPAVAATDEEAELEALLDVLEGETELATKSRMNSDFVPGIITVLDGAKLEAQGVRTVWEALPFVPGVRAELDARGTPTLTARGIPFPFNSGSIRILLNSMPIGREDAGVNGSALTIPIAQVERIEFIRGPGSVLYGDFAFQGLLNIITRKGGERIEIGADDHGARSGSLLYSGGDEERGFSANLAGWSSDVAIVRESRSAQERRFSGVVNIELDEFSVLAQALDRRLFDFAGGPPDPGFDETAWSLGARHEHAFTPDLETRVHAQFLDNEIRNGNTYFRGDSTRIGGELNWSGWERQVWLIGIEHNVGDTDEGRTRPGGPPPPAPQPPERRVFDRHREVLSLFVQDQIELTPHLRFTLGARYDDNSEIGSRLTPRASLVWQPAEHHVLKAQYAEGYRAPNFFELYTMGNATPDLGFEVNATTEFTYIYRRPQLTARATLFQARIDNMSFGGPRGFDNVAMARSEGIELEWSQQIGTRWQIDANLSHSNAIDNRNQQLITRAITSNPEWMGILGLLYKPSRDLGVGLSWNHIGERDALPGDDSSYDRVDLNLNLNNLFLAGLDLRLGVDNLANTRSVHLLNQPNGVIAFPFRDRVVWAQWSWALK